MSSVVGLIHGAYETSPRTTGWPHSLDAEPVAPTEVATIPLDGLPCYFVENLGQVGDGRVLLYAVGEMLSVGFARDGVEFVIHGPMGDTEASRTVPSATTGRVTRVSLRFEGARHVTPEGRVPLGTTNNYLYGNDPGGWVKGVRSYKEVWYEDLFDSIDLRYYFKDGLLKYDYVLGAGADVASIRCRYDGVDRLEIDPRDGGLLVRTREGTLRDSRPCVLRSLEPSSEPVPVAYALHAGGAWGFNLPEWLCDGSPLVIDPGLVFGTYIGGSSKRDLVRCIALDEQGYIYLSASTQSPDFPVTPGSLDEDFMDSKGVVLKLDPTGSSIIWSTFYGSKSTSAVYDMFDTYSKTLSVRPDGSILLVGMTGAVDFPTTPDAYSRTHWGIGSGTKDLFVMVLGPDGDEIIYGSYIGGSHDEICYAHVLDRDGNLFILGATQSLDLPVTEGAFCATNSGIWDVLLLKMSPTLEELLLCTYFGGRGSDYGTAIALDEQGSVIIGGYTLSTDFPTTEGAFCTTAINSFGDGLVMRLNGTGHQTYSTLLGGRGLDGVDRVEVGANGTLYVLSETQSDDFPVMGPGAHGLFGERDVALTVFDRDMQLLHSTYIGGSNREACQGSVLDGVRGMLYLSITTASNNIATTKGCFCPLPVSQPYYEFIMGINLSTLRTTYSTYFWTGAYWSTDEPVTVWGQVMTADSGGCIYISGYTGAEDFPTTSGAVFEEYQGGISDGYVIKLDPRPVDLPLAPSGVRTTCDDRLVNISWASPANESYITVKHYVYRDDYRIGEAVFGNDHYVDADILNGITYHYRVSAVNGAGEGPRSDAVEARPVGYPSPPLGLVASSGDGCVTLSWRAPTDTGGIDVPILGYHVLRGTGGGGLDPHDTIDPNETYRDSKALELGKDYTYAVVAFNERGNGTPSAIAGCKATAPPGPPINLTALAGNGSITLSWDAPSGLGGGILLGFNIYIWGDDGEPALAHTNKPSERSYQIGQLTNGLRYHIRVTAFTEIDESEGAGGDIVVVPIGPPGAPSSIRADGDNGSVLLSWDPPGNDGGIPILGYQIYGGPTVESMAPMGEPVDSTEMRIPLANGQTWHFTVAAMNEAGEGPRSPTVSATAMAPPSIPPHLQGSLLPAGILLSWEPPQDWGGAPSLVYIVLRGVSEAALIPVAQPVDALTWLDMDIQAGVTYHYRVKAVNPNGDEGPSSNPVILRFLTATTPSAPRNLTAKAGDAVARLVWDEPSTDGGSPILRYIVMRGRDQFALAEIATVIGLRYDDYGPGLENGVIFYYKVYAENAVGVGNGSDVTQARPLPPPGKPSLTAEGRRDSTVLAWESPGGDVAPVTGYVVLRGRSPSELVIVAELGVVTGFTDEDVEPGRPYYYGLRARSESGDSPMSDVIQVILPPDEESSWLLPLLLVLAIVLVGSTLAWFLRRRGKQASGAGIKPVGDENEGSTKKSSDGSGEPATGERNE